MDTIKLIILLLFIILLFYTIPLNNSKLLSSSYIPRDNSTINNTNMGFVKPEHRLLKIFNTISSGSKIKLEGVCQKYIYNKNTIDKSVEDRLTKIMKDLIDTINQISQKDYYIKQRDNNDKIAAKKKYYEMKSESDKIIESQKNNGDEQ